MRTPLKSSSRHRRPLLSFGIRAWQEQMKNWRLRSISEKEERTTSKTKEGKTSTPRKIAICICRQNAAGKVRCSIYGDFK